MFDTILISRLRFILTLMLGLGFLFFIPLFELDKILPKPIFFGFILIFTFGPAILAFRLCRYRKEILITDDLIRIGDLEFNWNDIKSYKLEYSSFMETLMIKLKNNKKIYLTGFVDGRKAKQFQWMKIKFQQRLERYNNAVVTDDKIKRTGLFESKFAKPLGFHIIGLILTGIVFLFTGRIDKPQTLLIFIAVSTPILLQIFKKRNNH